MAIPWYKKRKRLQLSAFPSRNCWRKHYKGKMYYLRHPLTTAGYDDALAEWELKKAEIDADAEKVAEADRIRTRDFTDRLLDSQDEQPELAPVYHAGVAVGGMHQADVEAAKDKARRKTAGASETDAAIKAFLDFKEVQALTPDTKVTIGRWESLRCHLAIYTSWEGVLLSVRDITEQTVSDFYLYLIQLEDISQSYGQDVFNSWRQFVEWCFNSGLTESIPRNLRHKQFRFEKKKTRKSIVVWDVEQVQTLLAECSERTRLYILLALNCGYYQKDIATLEHTDIDFRTGRITRPRSKTGVDLDLSYLLWDETLELLKRYCTKKTHSNWLLLNRDGRPLYQESITNIGGRRRAKKTDNIKSATDRLLRKLKLAGGGAGFMTLRKSGATALGGHELYKFYGKAYLCQSHDDVADRYLIPNQDEFDAAIAWLGKQFLGE